MTCNCYMQMLNNAWCITCVTDNWTAHRQCMLHKKLIYCSHILLKPIVLLSILWFATWNATSAKWMPHSEPEMQPLVAYLLGGANHVSSFTNFPIMMWSLMWTSQSCATSARTSQQVSEPKLNSFQFGYIGATHVTSANQIQVHLMIWLCLI